MLRSPIITTMGHIDHGKTTLLDAIRGTVVAAHEAGAITQWAGCSFLPAETIKNICGKMLEQLNIKIEIPGLLLLDTPGHAAFKSIRARGGSLADIAILVIDIGSGIQAQTLECISILKQYKTPFVVAATKIDKTPGWAPHKNACFMESFSKQSEAVQAELENNLWKLIGQLSEQGFDADRFDRVKDFTKTIAIVPVSGITGEGVPELLVILSGLAQIFLKDKIKITSDIGRGTILEVKETRGYGITIDVILYDGSAHVGNWLIIGGKDPIVTKIRAILKPKPLKEIRIEKEFESVENVTAAAGIKIAAPGLEKAVSGSPVAILAQEQQIEYIKSELQKEVANIEYETSEEGIILRADTIGSLEALLFMTKEHDIDVKKAEVGPPSRTDILMLQMEKNPLNKFIFAFNVEPSQEIVKMASDNKISIISGSIIYSIFEEFERQLNQKKQEIKQEKLSTITLPARIKILPGCVFHVSNPAIVGVEILEGTIRIGARLTKAGKEIGQIKAIQSENISLECAKKSEKVAISIEGPIVGRHIFEGDVLETVITQHDIDVLEELGMNEELALAKEISGQNKWQT